jgi:subtilase family serine protease
MNFKKWLARFNARRGKQSYHLGFLQLEDRVVPSGGGIIPFYIPSPNSGPSPQNSPWTGPDGAYTPIAIQTAYGLTKLPSADTGAGQTIALVDAYNDPSIKNDLAVFDSLFGLSAPPSFQVVSQTGSTTALPPSSPPGDAWDPEEALDVEWAHAMAPGANIILVECNSENSLYTGVRWAATPVSDGGGGASVVSMSFGSDGGFDGEDGSDSNFSPDTFPGVTFLASTGDSGSNGFPIPQAGYPSDSPYVVAVGGTSLYLDATDPVGSGGGTYESETGWNDQFGAGGGGISNYESQPSYQAAAAAPFSTTQRTAPDVAFVADPETGVEIYDSQPDWGGLRGVGGTSLSSPAWAGLIAIADQVRASEGLSSLTGYTQTLPRLYDIYGSDSYSSDFHDVTQGSNGTYSADTGYDLATGIGSPIANTLIPNLAGSPIITGNPNNASIGAGGNTSFSSTGRGVAGDTAPTAQWQVSTDNGATFNNVSDGILYSGATTPTLSITGATPGMSGFQYRDVFTNVFGSATTAAATLTVVSAPTVTENTALIASNAKTIIIKGTGFSSIAANDSVTFNLGAVGTVTSATSTSLTVTFSSSPAVGNLTAVVSVSGSSSGAPVQVATVALAPAVTQNRAVIATTTSTITINGANFSSTPANDSVTFNLGAVGSVTAATASSLTVTFSTPPTSTGSLTAVVTANGLSSGNPVQVATVAFTPTVTQNTATIVVPAATITINGANYSSNAANDSVVFNDGAVGTVTAATTTSLTVMFSTQPTAVGTLTAVVGVSGLSSGAPVQVGTVVFAPTVTLNTGTIATTATTITIAGANFSPVAANNSVTFNLGAVGTVTAATATSLTVTFSKPPSVGNLTAVVTTESHSSGSAVQVATVANTPTVTQNSATFVVPGTTITIAGTSFSSVAANDSVVFNDGALGTVTAATTTSLTVTLSTQPTALGTLTAVVGVSGLSSGTPVQVGTVAFAPAVTPSTATIVPLGTTITIDGANFSPVAANDSVAFNLGAVGTVTAASSTSLTVTFSTSPTIGNLTAVVTAAGLTSGSPVQVATVVPTPAPTVTLNTALFASTMTINGTFFSPVAANDSVAFNLGAVGTVTAATSTSLTVAFSTLPTSTGSLTAVVTEGGLSSGSPVQVGTVTPAGTYKRQFIVLAGNTGTAAILDAVTGRLIRYFQPFNAPGITPYTGAMSVALADVNGDGIPDIIVATRGTRAGKVKVFDGASAVNTLAPMGAGDTLFQERVLPGYDQGLTLATGDVNGDDKTDIILGLRSTTLTNGAGTIPATVLVLSADSAGGFRQTAAFHPFTPGYTGGLYLAAGPTAVGGKAQIAVSSTLSSDVQIWSANSGAPMMTAQFRPFGSAPFNGTSGDGQIAAVDAMGTGADFFATGFLNSDGSVTIDVNDTTGVQQETFTDGSRKQFFAFNTVHTTAGAGASDELGLALTSANSLSLLDPLTDAPLASLASFLLLTGQNTPAAKFTVAGS